jgi:deoxycytidylate deaminase
MGEKFDKVVDISRALTLKDSPLRCQHFSFILYRNRIISIGQNSKKTSPKNLRNKHFSRSSGKDISHNKGTCSELAAIVKLKNTTNIDFKKCVLINVRIDKKGKMNNSKPCGSCRSLLSYFSFKKVFYTSPEGFEEYTEQT